MGFPILVFHGISHSQGKHGNSWHIPRYPAGYPTDIPPPQRYPKGYPTRYPTGIPRNIPRDIPRGIPEESYGIPHGMPHGIPHGMPHGISHGISHGTSCQTNQCASHPNPKPQQYLHLGGANGPWLSWVAISKSCLLYTSPSPRD